MNDIFWGFVVLALAVLCAANLLRRGLDAIARGLAMRNALLASLGRHTAARVRGITSDEPRR